MSGQESKAYFKGLLTNVDSSILQMNFNHGFSIAPFSEEETTAFISRLEKIPAMTVAQKYFFDQQCFSTSEVRMYAISGSFELKAKQDSSAFHSEMARFSKSLIRGYLEPLLRLMRLFKEGDIRMPVRFCYRDKMPPRAITHVDG